MKRTLLYLAVCLLSLAPSLKLATATEPAGPTVELPAKTRTVYVTRTGKKYHRAGCRYLRQSCIKIDLSTARRLYTPCKVCKP